MSELRISPAAIKVADNWNKRLHELYRIDERTAMFHWLTEEAQKAINSELDRIAGPLVESLEGALCNQRAWKISAEEALSKYRKERGE